MKYSLLFILVLVSTSIFSQFSTTIKNVDGSVSNPRYTIAGDIDGDNDNDILTVSNTFLPTSYKLFLYKNDGSGVFSSAELVYNNSNLYSVFLYDYDNDNDLDIISALSDDIIWFENDGTGSFSGATTIITDAFTDYIEVEDIDGDGDGDLMGYDGNNVFWIEDTDGNKTFGSKIIINNFEERPTKVLPTDLDGDNDLDLVVTYFFDRSVVWYENIDGKGLFSARKDIVSFADGASNVFAFDIDGDTDKDIVFGTAAAGVSNRIAWKENLDGNGNFSPTENIVVVDSDSTYSVFNVVDFDSDNDYDIIVAGSIINRDFSDERVVLFENNGLGTFNSEFSFASVQDSILLVDDLDGDDSKDLILTKFWNDKIVWYKNTFLSPTLSIGNNENLNWKEFTLFPIPARNIVHAEYENMGNRELYVSVYDAIGRKLIKEEFVLDGRINISNLDRGMYFLQFNNESNLFKIIKE